MTASRTVDDFLVYIVESPSAADLYDQRFEGAALRDSLRLAEVNSLFRIAVSRDMFRQALTDGIRDATVAYPRHIPLLHLSAHGCEDGIGLTDGTLVGWPELADLIRPINEHFAGMLILCLSACKGFNVVSDRLRSARLPFEYLIASTESPSWADTMVGFLTFYHHVRRGSTFSIAAEAMRAASGFEHFVFFHANNPWP